MKFNRVSWQCKYHAFEALNCLPESLIRRRSATRSRRAVTSPPRSRWESGTCRRRATSSQVCTNLHILARAENMSWLGELFSKSSTDVRISDICSHLVRSVAAYLATFCYVILIYHTRHGAEALGRAVPGPRGREDMDRGDHFT